MKQNSYILGVIVLFFSFSYASNSNSNQGNQIISSTQTIVETKLAKKNDTLKKKDKIDSTFKKGEGYCKLKSSSKDYIVHIEVGIADEVEIAITDIKNYRLNKVKFTTRPKIVDGKYAYEYVFTDIGNGEYKFKAIAKKGKEVLNFEGSCLK